MKIGILGGTFNPPHIGHCILAQEMMDKLSLEKILFIPTNISPHKQESKMVSAQHRLEMVSRMIQDRQCFAVSDYEIKREGISYTVDTLEYLKGEYPNDEISLIIGSDLACQFKQWRSPERIRELARIVVGRRREFPAPTDNAFLPVDILQIEISSSRIRQMRTQGLSVQYLLNGRVYEYIEQHRLYL